jgi:hypothetical protein
MQVLTASTLLLLAASPVAATEFQLLEPAPSRVMAMHKAPQPEPFPLLKQTADAGAAAFVFADGARAPDSTAPAKLEAILPTRETVCEKLANAASESGLPILFFVRLIWQESGFDPFAISHAGAQGVAQFMPRVAAEMGLADPFDPAQALPKSAQFLRSLRDQFGNLGLAAAAYNAGAKRVQDWLDKGRRLPKETRDYVRNITGHAAELWKDKQPQALAVGAPARLPCHIPEIVTANASEPPATIAKTDRRTNAERVQKARSRSQRPLHFIEPGPDLAHARRARGAIYVARDHHAHRLARVADASAKTSSGEPRGTSRSHQRRAVILVNHKAGRAGVRMVDRQKRERTKPVRLALAARPSHARR